MLTPHEMPFEKLTIIEIQYSITLPTRCSSAHPLPRIVYNTLSELYHLTCIGGSCIESHRPACVTVAILLSE